MELTPTSKKMFNSTNQCARVYDNFKKSEIAIKKLSPGI